MSHSILTYCLLVYLLGAIPFGDIFARLFRHGTVFKDGTWTTKPSGDVFELLGMKLGIVVTALDILKGWIAMSPLLNRFIQPSDDAYALVVCLGGILVVIGHCHSVFLGFKGGKGLAPTAGVLFTILPIPAFIAFLVWASLSFWGLSIRPGAVSAAGAMPVVSIPYIWFFAPDKLVYLYVVGALSICTMWEYRTSLLSYMGLGPSCPPPPSPASPAEPVEPTEPKS